MLVSERNLPLVECKPPHKFVVDWSEHSYLIEWKPISRWWLVAPSGVSGSVCTYNMVPDQGRRKGTINITSLKKHALC
jgi:hypothetical protein